MPKMKEQPRLSMDGSIKAAFRHKFESYVLHKALYMSPIAGGLTVDHLAGSINALKVK